MRQFDIDYSWCPVKVAPSQNYSYPQKTSEFVNENYAKATVYRWAVYKEGAEPVRAYIGETENLAKRISQYLRGDRSQRQVFRVKHELLEPARMEGLKVEVQILESRPFLLNGVPFAQESLSSEVLRKTMQWFAI